jgi:hypothetical protein
MQSTPVSTHEELFVSFEQVQVEIYEIVQFLALVSVTSLYPYD